MLADVEVSCRQTAEDLGASWQGEKGPGKGGSDCGDALRATRGVVLKQLACRKVGGEEPAARGGAPVLGRGGRRTVGGPSCKKERG